MNKSELLSVAKPILFNTSMVQAILDGRKTATRRVIKYPACGYFEYEPPRVKKPYQTGDILYVRETWNICNLDIEDNTITFVYKASESEKEEGAMTVKASDEIYDKYDYSMVENNPDWRPSIHMPKEAARIFLRVTDVRVERLQDITEEQAEKEGAINTIGFIHSYDNEYAEKPHTAIDDFFCIWDSTIKKTDLERYGWDANPWVWVIEFE